MSAEIICLATFSKPVPQKSVVNILEKEFEKAIIGESSVVHLDKEEYAPDERLRKELIRIASVGRLKLLGSKDVILEKHVFSGFLTKAIDRGLFRDFELYVFSDLLQIKEGAYAVIPLLPENAITSEKTEESGINPGESAVSKIDADSNVLIDAFPLDRKTGSFGFEYKPLRKQVPGFVENICIIVGE